MKQSRKKPHDMTPQQWTTLVVALLVVAVGASAAYGYTQLATLSTNIASLEARFASTTALLEQNIEQTQNTFSDALEQERTHVKEQLDDFGSEVNEITLSVSDLEKLSKTDPELLQKYSKVYFLNEHYVPVRLVAIPDKHKYFEQRNNQIHAEVWSFLEELLEDAESDGEELFVFSAYRSYDKQSTIKGQYTTLYGEGANRFSADQGYSEHQLGTTVDLITTGINGTLDGFETTSAYAWLVDNAHKYGFTLSYPKGNTFYIFEPWHWRFVGVALATELKESDRNFYDLDQREIDTYMISLFD